MASGSRVSSSSMSLFHINGADQMDPTMNSQHNLNVTLPTASVPVQENHQPVAPKKKSKQPAAGPSYPDADAVIEVSAATLLSTDRHVCDVCFKGFLRKQNLIFHQRVHNLPVAIKSTSPPVKRRVYLCPEPACPHHNRVQALGDFGGLRKHYLRKHCTQKRHKCEACSREYAAKTDLIAHLKVCGKKKYTCHCGSGFSRHSTFVVHQESCVARDHEGAAKHSPALHIGDSSVKTTFNNSNNSGSSSSNNNNNNSSSSSSNNNNNLIDLNNSHLSLYSSAIQTPSMYDPFSSPYQSQLYPSGTDNRSQMFPDNFFPSSTQQNQHKLQEDFNIGLYTALLTDKISLDDVNRENVRFKGDGGDINEYGKGSTSFSSGGSMLNLSSSPMLTPDVCNTSLIEKLNPVCGEGSSTFNQDFGASHDQGGYYAYGDGGGHFDYGGGMEAVNFETSAATAKVVAPYEQHLNQFRGLWF